MVLFIIHVSDKYVKKYMKIVKSSVIKILLYIPDNYHYLILFQFILKELNKKINIQINGKKIC